MPSARMESKSAWVKLPSACMEIGSWQPEVYMEYLVSQLCNSTSAAKDLIWPSRIQGDAGIVSTNLQTRVRFLGWVRGWMPKWVRVFFRAANGLLTNVELSCHAIKITRFLPLQNMGLRPNARIECHSPVLNATRLFWDNTRPFMGGKPLLLRAKPLLLKWGFWCWPP